MRQKAVHLLVDDALPPELRTGAPDVSAKGLATLMHQVAVSHPDRYKDTLKQIGDAGREAAYWQGESMGLEDLRPVIDTPAYLRQMDAEVAQATKGLKDPDAIRTTRENIWHKWSANIQKASMKAALAKGNAVGLSVASGARGKPLQLQAMLSTPGTFETYKGHIIPIFARRSYAEGVSPAEWLAGTYGARTSTVSTKVATALGGHFCLAEGTMVQMVDGTTRPIQSLQPGDMVYGADKTGKVRPVKVVHLFDQGVQDVRRYTFRANGARETFEETCTASHKFLFSQAYRQPYPSVQPIENYRNRTRIAAVDGFDDTGLPDEEFDLMLGLMLGDGYMPADKVKSRVVFSCFDTRLLEDALPYLQATGHYFTKLSSAKQVRISRTDINGRSFRLWLMNDCQMAGHLAYDKHIPHLVHGWSNASVMRLFVGLLATDGSLAFNDDKCYINMASASERMLKELKALMTFRFGIAGTNVSQVREAGPGLICGVPCQVQNGYGWQIARRTELAKLLPWLQKYLPGVKRDRLADLQRWVEAGQKSQPLTYQIEKKSEPFSAHCWDIEVDHPDHLFVLASGLITSNSKMLGQVSAPMMVTTADCGTNNGIELAKNDASMRNRFLATDTAGVKGGSLLDRKTLGHLVNNHKGDTLIVRSPLTCQAPEGLCAKCLGADPRGHLYPVGYGAGFTAANAIGEPLCLHGSTLVRMADGSTKLITDIQPGDMVLGSDMEGKLTPTKVLRWFENGRRVCVRTVARIGTSQEVELISTTAHKILSHKGPKGSVVRPKIQPVESTDTRERHTLLVANHERPCDPAAHAEVIEQLFFSYDLTYDIEVDNDTHLFALANGLVISNTQLALNSKHTSGAATKKKSYSGLSWLQRFVQIPDNFPDRAPVAEQAGSVSVQPAPQGGNYVYVGDKTHYVPQHLNLLVKTGQQVEAGQPLSEGIIRPDDVVRLRGLGEGRNYYATRLHQMLDDSGAANDRRNVEVVARAAVNHVRITDADGWKGHLPDDMVPYNHVLKDFEPAEDSEEKAPHEAVGQYLQKAALHYTPGTQLTSSMADQLHKAGYKSLLVSKTGPGFEPEMVRLQTQSFATPDWLAALGTSYLSKQLATRAQRGQDTNIRSNIHFAPRLAIGEGFGADAARTGKF
jgi:Hint module